MKKYRWQHRFNKAVKSCWCEDIFRRGKESFEDAQKDSFYFENANVLVFNEGGFEKYKGERTWEETDQSLFSKGVEIIVTTLGSKGCIVRTPHWIQEYPGVKVDVKRSYRCRRYL